MYEAHPTDPGLTRWTGYLDVRILHSRYFGFVTNMVIEQATKHFQRQTQESLGHDGSAGGFCARDVFRRVCTPYVQPLGEGEEEAAAAAAGEGGAAAAAAAAAAPEA